MWSASVPNQGKAGGWLLTASIICGTLDVLLAQFSYELCHRGIPLTVPVVALPVIGAICGLASLFYPASSRALVATKLLVTAANAYQTLVALLSLTGMGLIACS